MSDLQPILRPGTKKRRRMLPWVFLSAIAIAVAAAILFLFFSRASSKDDEVQQQVKVPAIKAEPKSLYLVDTDIADRHIDIKFGRPPRAGMLFNLKTGEVLWQRNPDKRLPIASLTKMMTALVIVERTSPHERVSITKEAVEFKGSGVGALPRGKRVQLEALMNGLLLVSGNDASIALAQHISGSQKEFIALMNRRARSLDLNCSHFTTPNGLRDSGNWSCARDLAALARADLSQSRIRRIARRSYISIKFPIKGGKLDLANNNPLIRQRYPGTSGLKTGFTDKSGRCIVATAKRGKTELGVVLLHSYNPYLQATKLLNKGFQTFK